MAKDVKKVYVQKLTNASLINNLCKCYSGAITIPKKEEMKLIIDEMIKRDMVNETEIKTLFKDFISD